MSGVLQSRMDKILHFVVIEQQSILTLASYAFIHKIYESYVRLMHIFPCKWSGLD